MPKISGTICYNCFRELPSNSGAPSLEENSAGGPCPYCGFDLEENAKKYPVALRAGTILNQRYIVGRVLGQGGFGITYLAWDTKLSAKVAVKEYMPNEIAARIGTTVSVAMESRAEDFTYGAERFQEEARTLAKFMGQPNIAGVTDYFDENDTSYFVMDYIEGISFKTYIANQGGKVTIEEALDVMIPVLRALTAVHSEGFIHRDVTPDNIYITKDGNVKLLDFGSARYSIGDKSKSLDVILKVGYAPKEQYIRRGRQRPYTDVYSCAACLYAAITGFLPPESLERLDHDTLIPPSEAGVEIPLYLERAILKGLAVQPEDRFQTAAEFLEAIESQQVVELNFSQDRENNNAQHISQSKSRIKLLPIIIGGAAFAAIAFAAGTLLDRDTGNTGVDSEIEYASEGNKSSDTGDEDFEAEDNAPKVTIAGEEYSTALTELNLQGKGLTDADILPLQEMTNLKVLLLDGNQLSDIAPLSKLTSLEELRLGGDNGGNDGIQDLTPLSGLTQLKILHLPASSLNDLSPLAGLDQLEDLALRSGDSRTSGVSDPTPLASLTNLKELYLVVSSLDSLEFVSGMTKLQSLRINAIGKSSVQDLSPLSNLIHLQTLSLPSTEGDGCIDLGPLSGLTQLTDLKFGCNIVSLEPLRGLTKLATLDLNDQPGRAEGQFQSLEPLSGLTNLTSLTLRGGHVKDLSPLMGLSKLQFLTLHTPEVTDLTPLANLNELVTFSFDGDNVTDWSPVEHVPNVNRN